MSYDICIWDPDRHGPLPIDADQAQAMVDKLGNVRDTWYLSLAGFAEQMVAAYAADAPQKQGAEDLKAFWGQDPRDAAKQCTSAVYRLSFPVDPCIQQMAYAVDAAAAHGWVVFDDECGMCFLPDGSIFPHDMREIWESDLADMKAGPPDPLHPKPDGRTFWERLGGELFDAIGRGNRRS